MGIESPRLSDSLIFFIRVRASPIAVFVPARFVGSELGCPGAFFMAIYGVMRPFRFVDATDWRMGTLCVVSGGR